MEGALSLIATGEGGGITISTSQKNSGNNWDGVFRGETNILAKNGPIKFLAGQSGGIANGYFHIGTDNNYWGSKSGSLVPTSSSDILIQYDRFDFAGRRPYIGTSGSVSIQPASSSFGQDISSALFRWNQNGLTMDSLSIGKLGNTANITLETNPITVAGPIGLYGGVITLNANLTSFLLNTGWVHNIE